MVVPSSLVDEMRQRQDKGGGEEGLQIWTYWGFTTLPVSDYSRWATRARQMMARVVDDER